MVIFLSLFLGTPQAFAFPNEPQGWGEWEWGRNLNEIIHELNTPLIEKGAVFRYDFVQSYYKGLDKPFCTIKDPSVRYWFAQDRLFAVKIVDWMAYPQKWEDVKIALIEKYGLPSKVDYEKERKFGTPGIAGELGNDPADFYYWYGEKARISATFYPKAARIVIFIFSPEQFDNINSLRDRMPKEMKNYPNEPSGFRGISWGTNITKVQDKLKFKKFLSGISGSGIALYENPKDELSFGAGHASSITYEFWQDKFLSAYISVDSERDWVYVLRAIRAQFGYGIGHDLMPRWNGETTTIVGYFNTGDNKGTFYFTSSLLGKEKDKFDTKRVKTGSGDF